MSYLHERLTLIECTPKTYLLKLLFCKKTLQYNKTFGILLYKRITKYVIPVISRHTIVCRAAQEAGAPHREYIDRKKENVIFTHLYLGDTSSDWNQICCRVARQLGESTFQI